MFGIQIKEQTIEKKKTGFVITNEEKNVMIMICCHRYHWHHWTGFLLCCVPNHILTKITRILIGLMWQTNEMLIVPGIFSTSLSFQNHGKKQLVGCIRLFQSLHTKSLVNKKIQKRDKPKLRNKPMCFLLYYTIGFYVEQELSIVLVLCIWNNVLNVMKEQQFFLCHIK